MKVWFENNQLIICFFFQAQLLFYTFHMVCRQQYNCIPTVITNICIQINRKHLNKYIWNRMRIQTNIYMILFCDFMMAHLMIGQRRLCENWPWEVDAPPARHLWNCAVSMHTQYCSENPGVTLTPPVQQHMGENTPHN